ncbi:MULTISPECIES: major coat protein [Aeromonas]|jgi:hypothetical protein|nr:major coat protein [Aeromonas salmonicida]
MKNYFRNGCIAVVGAISGSAFAEGTGAAEAAGKALDATQSDVTATSPKVMLVVATCVGVGILISLMRKA